MKIRLLGAELSHAGGWTDRLIDMTKLTVTFHNFAKAPTNLDISIARLRSQSPRHFAWQHSARVSLTLRSSYLSHVTAAATLADQYWHLRRSDYRNTLIYAHTISRTLPTCDVSHSSLTLLAPESGDVVESILLCQVPQKELNKGKNQQSSSSLGYYIYPLLLHLRYSPSWTTAFHSATLL